MLEDNSIEAADFFLGAAIANVVRVPLYPRNARESHEHMLGHTGCRAVVVSSNHAAELDGISEAVASIEQVIVRDDGYEDWLGGFSDIDPDVDGSGSGLEGLADRLGGSVSARSTPGKGTTITVEGTAPCGDGDVLIASIHHHQGGAGGAGQPRSV